MSHDLRQTAQTRAWNQVLSVCPPEIADSLGRLSPGVRERIEEIRFRLGQPVQVCGSGIDHFVTVAGTLTTELAEALVITDAHLSRVLQVVTQSSLYAVEDELKRGFITMPGGHRVGVAGRAVLYENGYVRSIRSISSANVRVARERLGAADSIKATLERTDGRPYNVLIVSPPQCGKTTLIRDLARQWSEGKSAFGGARTSTQPGLKVSIIDERSEIAGSVDGQAQFRIGPRTDVLDACPKAEGMLMAIRSLSPDLVVTDEIGRKQDRDAILEATHAGVAVLTSAHASSLEEWSRRPYMGELFAAKAFHRYVILSRRRGPGTVDAVLDANGKLLKSGQTVAVLGSDGLST